MVKSHRLIVSCTRIESSVDVDVPAINPTIADATATSPSLMFVFIEFTKIAQDRLVHIFEFIAVRPLVLVKEQACLLDVPTQ